MRLQEPRAELQHAAEEGEQSQDESGVLHHKTLPSAAAIRPVSACRLVGTHVCTCPREGGKEGGGRCIAYMCAVCVRV